MHQDLKPQNCMVSLLSGVLKVCDFGLRARGKVLRAEEAAEGEFEVGEDDPLFGDIAAGTGTVALTVSFSDFGVPVSIEPPDLEAPPTPAPTPAPPPAGATRRRRGAAPAGAGLLGGLQRLRRREGPLLPGGGVQGRAR